MLARILLGVLADLVFDSAASTGRAYNAEMARYLARRGFVAEPRTRQATTS